MEIQWKTTRGPIMTPTQISVVARQRKKSFDGGRMEDSLRSASRITTFPRKAVMDRKMLKVDKNVNWGRMSWIRVCDRVQYMFPTVACFLSRVSFAILLLVYSHSTMHSTKLCFQIKPYLCTATAWTPINQRTTRVRYTKYFVFLYTDCFTLICLKELNGAGLLSRQFFHLRSGANNYNHSRFTASLYHLLRKRNPLSNTSTKHAGSCSK